MANAIAGLRGGSDWATDERPKNFREMILWRDPNGQTPLTALMSRMSDQTTDDPEFAWYEEELKPTRIKVSAQAVQTATSLTVDVTTGDADALDLVAGDLLMVEKLESTTLNYEIVEVTTTPTTSTTLAVTRGAAGTTANTATIATNSYLLKIGSAYEEGALSPDSSTRKPSKFFNYTQIYKTTYRITNTAAEINLRTGDPIKNDKKRKMFDHAAAMELGFLFGSRLETTGTAGKPKRYTGGLYYWLASTYNATTNPNIKIWTTSAVTEADILDAMYRVFDYGYTGAGNERIGLCGNGFLNGLNKIVSTATSTRVNYDSTIKYFGMELQKWVLPQGTIYLRTHPLMNVNTRFTNGCFLINPAAITYRPLRNRDTKFKDNVQANDADETKGLWLTECGAEFHHLKSQMYLALNTA